MATKLASWGPIVGSGIELSGPNNSIATDVAFDVLQGDDGKGRYRPVVGTFGVDIGKVEWQVKILSSCRITVGICTDKITAECRDGIKQALFQNSNAWVFTVEPPGVEDAAKWHANKKSSTGLPGLNVGSHVGIRLDCEARTVTFTVNGRTTESSTFEDLPAETKFFPCAAFGGSPEPGGKIELHQVDSRRSDLQHVVTFEDIEVAVAAGEQTTKQPSPRVSEGGSPRVSARGGVGTESNVLASALDVASAFHDAAAAPASPRQPASPRVEVDTKFPQFQDALAGSALTGSGSLEADQIRPAAHVVAPQSPRVLSAGAEPMTQATPSVHLDITFGSGNRREVVETVTASRPLLAGSGVDLDHSEASAALERAGTGHFGVDSDAALAATAPQVVVEPTHHHHRHHKKSHGDSTAQPQCVGAEADNAVDTDLPPKKSKSSRSRAEEPRIVGAGVDDTDGEGKRGEGAPLAPRSPLGAAKPKQMPRASNGDFADRHGRAEQGEYDAFAHRLPGDRSIDRDNDCYPECIVWTPIVPISWVFPMVGHMGIGDSRGQVFEFNGGGATLAPKGGLSFGPVCRYIQLPISWCTACDWDEGIRRACEQCDNRCHKFCFHNCHTFVADCLNHMRYGGFCCWNQFILIWLMFFFGRYTSMSRSLQCIGPFVLVAGVIAGVFYFAEMQQPSK